MTSPSTAILRALPTDPPRCETVGDLALSTGLSDRQIANAIQVLQRRGLLSIAKPGCYLITRAGRDWLASGQEVHPGQGEKPRQQARGLAARAWWVMRTRPVGITLDGLLATVATGEEKAARGTLVRYLVALELTGYLARSVARSACERAAYDLVRNSGPKPPVLRRQSATVYDPNDGEVRPLDPEANHGCP